MTPRQRLQRRRSDALEVELRRSAVVWAERPCVRREWAEARTKWERVAVAPKWERAVWVAAEPVAQRRERAERQREWARRRALARPALAALFRPAFWRRL